MTAPTREQKRTMPIAFRWAVQVVPARESARPSRDVSRGRGDDSDQADMVAWALSSPFIRGRA
jgi:hypothetical protein